MSIGLNVKIEKLKDLFTAKLYVGKSYTSYGEAEWNKKDDQDIPELSISGKTNYKELLLTKRTDGHSFFLPEQSRPALDGSKTLFTATVGIYFAVNLVKLYGSGVTRADAKETLHQDVLKITNNTSFIIQEIVPGLAAFDQFGFVKESDNMQPYYLVRFDTEVEYHLNCNN